MPVCAVCDSTQFACQDGKFFCIDCDTQSQDFVDEQAPEVLGESYSTKKLKKSTKKSKSSLDEGLPWHTAEGFQLIIKGHIDALIKLGINPHIKDIVRQIWFKFVHKSGLATIENGRNVDEKIDIRFRDFFLQNVKEEVIPTRSHEIRLRLSKRCKSSSKTASEGGSAKQLKDDEEWLSVDTGASSSEDADVLSEVEKSESCGYKPNINRVWKLVNVMSCLKVICFCYIALQWCGEPVTIGDLLRWIETGHLPFLGCIELLLPHMKVCGSDHNSFARRRPLKYSKVLLMSGALSKYLEIPQLPDVNVIELVTRYLIQLNLPTALVGYIRKFADKVDYKRPTQNTGKYRWTVSHQVRIITYCPDLIAAALIAVVIKILFVLNDKEEWETNTTSLQCEFHESFTDHSCNAFTWKNWVKQHLTQQEHKLQNEYVLFDDSAVREAGDVHACMENYLSLMIKGQTRIKFKGKMKEEMQENKQYAFKKLVAKQGSEVVKSKLTEKRKSIASAYKRLGYVDEKSSEDLTHACISIPMKIMKSRQRAVYVKYDQEKIDEKGVNFHQSYTFLLEILKELTRANTTDIHNNIRFVEKKTLRGFSRYK